MQALIALCVPSHPCVNLAVPGPGTCKDHTVVTSAVQHFLNGPPYSKNNLTDSANFMCTSVFSTFHVQSNLFYLPYTQSDLSPLVRFLAQSCLNMFCMSTASTDKHTRRPKGKHRTQLHAIGQQTGDPTPFHTAV
mmetsp:Transcript_12334/g.26634  ORF Transcript_12334/g.26634 Transcript_12334/m.26634 type:complete len:135 (-) Transcript_12334:1947-2351(-)